MRRLLSTCTLLLLVVAAAVADGRRVYLRGNIAGEGIELSTTDGNTYEASATLDDSKVFLFSDKFVYFECPELSYKSANIRINGGTYDVSFRLDTKAWDFSAPEDPWRISAFGSSVCNGQGASGNRGYAYLYGEQLRERLDAGLSENPFYVSGISIGGNTTQNLLDRYGDMTRDHAHYVIIGLSMGNEGVHEATDKQRIVDQFSRNMQTLISRIRQDGRVPVVMNNYTRGDFTPDDYAAIKQMNLMIHEWDVASVNTLGAIDDGAGHWASGYMQDNAHPTTAGHREFLFAMTPSLFDALQAGKPQPVRDQTGSMTLAGGDVLRWTVEGTVHPFTVSLRFRGRQAGRLMLLQLTAAARQGHVDIDDAGRVVYTNPTGRTITTTRHARSHRAARTPQLAQPGRRRRPEPPGAQPPAQRGLLLALGPLARRGRGPLPGPSAPLEPRALRALPLGRPARQRGPVDEHRQLRTRRGRRRQPPRTAHGHRRPRLRPAGTAPHLSPTSRLPHPWRPPRGGIIPKKSQRACLFFPNSLSILFKTRWFNVI